MQLFYVIEVDNDIVFIRFLNLFIFSINFLIDFKKSFKWLRVPIHNHFA